MKFSIGISIFQLGLIIAVLGLPACSQLSTKNADTFTNEGVLSGSNMDRAACKWPKTSIWVVVDGRGECIRYFHAGLRSQNDVVHIYFHGDGMTQNLHGGAWVWKHYQKIANSKALQKFADREFKTYGLPYIRFSRPGIFGSSGHHSKRRRLREVRVINTAIDALTERYKIVQLALSGQSGGGHITASLLALRNDIKCAVTAAGVVSVRHRARLHGWWTDITGYYDYFDPIDHVHRIPRDPNRRIFLVADPKDRNVPFATQVSYLKALRNTDHPAWLIRARGRGPSRHGLAQKGFRVVKWCLEGISPQEIQSRLKM